MFKKIKKHTPNVHSIIVGTSIILFWRGIWGIMDLYVFPGNKLLSYLIPGVLGLLLLFLNDFKLKEIE